MGRKSRVSTEDAFSIGVKRDRRINLHKIKSTFSLKRSKEANQNWRMHLSDSPIFKCGLMDSVAKHGNIIKYFMDKLGEVGLMRIILSQISSKFGLWLKKNTFLVNSWQVGKAKSRYCIKGSSKCGIFTINILTNSKKLFRLWGKRRLSYPLNSEGMEYFKFYSQVNESCEDLGLTNKLNKIEKDQNVEKKWENVVISLFDDTLNLKAYNASEMSYKMVGLMYKSILHLQKENEELRVKLGHCRWDTTRDQSSYVIANYDTYHTNFIKENANSDTGSNDPYQIARPTYYDHKVKARNSSTHLQKEPWMASKLDKLNLNEELYSWNTPTGRNNMQEFSKIGRVFKRTNSCRSNNGVNQIHSNSKDQKNTMKLGNDSDEEMKSFLEAEREAQEVYLTQSVKIIQVHPISTNVKNFRNVLNNQMIINWRTNSDSKRNEINIKPKSKHYKQSSLTTKKLMHNFDLSVSKESFPNELNWNKPQEIKFEMEGFHTEESEPEPQKTPKEALVKEPQQNNFTKVAKQKLGWQYPSTRTRMLKNYSGKKSLKSFVESDKSKPLCSIDLVQNSRCSPMLIKNST
jgi:hypothetical protein